MTKHIWLAGAAAFAVLLAVESPAEGARRTQRAKTVFPKGGPDEPRGTVAITKWRATKVRPERTRLVIRLKRLTPGATYSLWGDDPGDPLLRLLMFSPYEVSSPRGRSVVLTYRSDEGAFPFDAALEELGGKILQVRDATGAVVLAGSFPSFQ